jgi:hypothetical protein
MGPVLGTLFGAFVYDAFLYTGEENILNRLFVIFLSFGSTHELTFNIRGGRFQQRLRGQRRLEADDAV